MPTLVSHPDEVKVVSRRFGLGAADIDKYLELDGYKAVQRAIAEAPEWIINTMKTSGLPGPGVDFDIIPQAGAGASEVGEESALMESLEGKRGVPRIKPPFPAVVGLYGGPTVINNAETIANAPHILLMGGEGYAQLGTERNGGTPLFGISGPVEPPRGYQPPLGHPLPHATL